MRQRPSEGTEKARIESTAFTLQRRLILSLDCSAKLRLASDGRQWARRHRLELTPGSEAQRPAGETAQDEPRWSGV